MLKIQDLSVQPFETEHIEIVRKAAPECTLLLKKDGSLPLSVPCKIAAFGSGVRKTVKGGTGSGDVNVRHFVNIEEGLVNAGFDITSTKWLDSYDQLILDSKAAFIEQIKKEAAEIGLDPMYYSMGKNMPEPEYNLSLEGEGELAVYVLARNSGEGSDRSVTAGDINLSATEVRDILWLNEHYDKFVLILNIGGMVDLSPVASVKNILLLGQLGTPTGDVLADLLLGKSYPSGKLAMTWAPIQAYPSTEGFGDLDDTYYREGIYVGYRYFDCADVKINYPFGYGLSYTDFSIEADGMSYEDGNITVSVKVRNIGNHIGKEVVQVYYSAPDGKLDKPVKELIAFAKTKELAPGESERLCISFKVSDMASYDTKAAAYILEKGNYLISAGNASDHVIPVGYAVLSDYVQTVKLKNICPGWGFEDIIPERTLVKIPDGIPVIHIAAEDIVPVIINYQEEPKEIPAGEGCTWQEVVSGNKSIDDFISGLDSRQLTYLSMGAFRESQDSIESIIGASAESLAGAAGETTGKLKELGLPTIIMADGPAGIRVCKEYKIVDGKPKGYDNPLAHMMEYADPDKLAELNAMLPAPSEEELMAPVNYIHCIAIPIGTALAQSWNGEIADTLGDIVGKEMEMFDISLWLAPAMNIQRSPLCGRNFEYYSEDPVLSGCIAAAMTNGVQRHRGCGTTIKHFAANNQETNRLASNSILSERALREIYLKSFEICLAKSTPEALMTSYNLLNGEHTNNSRDIITYVLRDEWGFEGLVMTDWYGADGMMDQTNPRKNKHVPGCASGCIYAGNDIVMPGIQDEFNDIQHALIDKNVTYPINLAMLQQTAKRVLKCIQRLSTDL